ncbi:MAG: VIT and VWA domain-containing protein, partial [Azoarcus sp.]|nr:VIT and VWA domain-containing protein [Azoarcus sp.]
MEGINARLYSHDGDPIVFQGIKISGDLRGAMFEAVVEQRFYNPGEKNIEVVYDFPLPWNAVLLGVDVVLGDKRLTGAVVEKKEAEARYEDAIADGDAAIMLEKRYDGSYGINLGNLAAGESCVVTLRYAQLLRFEQGGLRLAVPSVIAPRYGDPINDGGLQPHQVTQHDLCAEYPLQLEIRLHGELARARVASPSHAIGVENGADAHGACLTVTLARAAVLDRDFVLVLDKLAHDSLVLVAPDAVEAEKVVVLASFCPRLRAPQGADATALPPVAVKILVDCSGSMEGDSIAAAREALHRIVGQLQDGDRFSLSRFGSAVTHRSRGLWKVTEPTKAAARTWSNQLEADMGGTEMEQALASTFALTKAEAVCDVLLITDGEIHAIDLTLQTAKASGHRIFVVGIGASPAEALLRRLAETTGGACDFVASGEGAQQAILRMFARLRSPRVAELTLEWPQGAELEWVSPMSTALFDGDTLDVFALARKLPTGEIRLKGKNRDAAEMTVAQAEIAPADETAANLSRLAAATRCSGAERAEATRLAVAYQLVSDHTNFLLIHERA